MADHESKTGWGGRTLFDADGDKIGTVGDVFADERSGEPAWITVRTGLLGRTHTFVPVRGAREVDGGVAVPVERQHVRDAPRVDDDGVLSHDEERALRQHYGLPPRPEPAAPSGPERDASHDGGAQDERRDDADHRVVPDRVIDPVPGDADAPPPVDDPTTHEEHHHG